MKHMQRLVFSPYHQPAMVVEKAFATTLALLELKTHSVMRTALHIKLGVSVTHK